MEAYSQYTGAIEKVQKKCLRNIVLKSMMCTHQEVVVILSNYIVQYCYLRCEIRLICWVGFRRGIAIPSYAA
ncbi:unnamed protein product [Acanthoscelides obtectus]|uniref:Uncharacterized protein n=1 Tax=Acanthoscelides obtectus TaxID=200917 RepID=A0A9P0K7Y0_ACAOB|nr:unnamed protein product [Acanthoscelides obtectus]CAK1639471.1 hypothetical protein AOBTE_LOCUS11196 [Acanthoscelides obtectus]